MFVLPEPVLSVHRDGEGLYYFPGIEDATHLRIQEHERA